MTTRRPGKWGSAAMASLFSVFLFTFPAAALEEGDILVPPIGPATVPGIFIPAEFLGLGTVRTGTFAAYGVMNPAYGVDKWADDLDALDAQGIIPEPASLLLLAGATLLASARRRRTT